MLPERRRCRMAFVQSQGNAPHPNLLPEGEGTEGARHKQRDTEPGYDDPTGVRRACERACQRCRCNMIMLDTLDFPGVALTCTSEVIIVSSQQPLEVLSSAVVGGGFVRSRYLLNRHVHRDYNCAEPAADLAAFARELGIAEAFI